MDVIEHYRKTLAKLKLAIKDNEDSGERLRHSDITDEFHMADLVRVGEAQLKLWEEDNRIRARNEVIELRQDVEFKQRVESHKEHMEWSRGATAANKSIVRANNAVTLSRYWWMAFGTVLTVCAVKIAFF